MAKNRIYPYKDADMLMASKIIAGNFKNNISELSTVRTDWTTDYSDKLDIRVNNVLEGYLGVNSKNDLLNATASLSAIQVQAKSDLSFFKTQIDDDFKDDKTKRDSINKILGFDRHIRLVQRGNQESLVQLLYTFKTNMSESLRTEITSRGLSDSLITKIIDYAATFTQANVTQETSKETSKELTQEVIDSFNDIYSELIGICKKASAYYRYEPLKKEQFTFSKVIKNLGVTRKVTENATEEVVSE